MLVSIQTWTSPTALGHKLSLKKRQLFLILQHVPKGHDINL